MTPTPDFPAATDPVEVAKLLMAAFVLGDTDGVLAQLAPDAVLRLPGDPAILPWAGTYTGESFRAFMDGISDHLDYLAYTAHTFHRAGDVVVVLSHERCRVKVTGRVFENDLVAVVTVKGGRVVSFVEYSDTGAMQAAYAD